MNTDVRLKDRRVGEDAVDRGREHNAQPGVLHVIVQDPEKVTKNALGLVPEAGIIDSSPSLSS